MSEIALRELEARINDIPPLTPAVSAMLELLNQPQVDCSALERTAMLEPALVARVLRLGNSAFFGVSGKVSTIREACLVLGTRTLRQMALAVAVLQQLSVDNGLFELRNIWQHALAVAAIGRRLAPLRKVDGEQAFTAGLLHDIGKLALAAYFYGEYQQVVARQRSECRLLVETERQWLGFDHGSVGELLARKWHLPETLALAIGRHHHPSSDKVDGLVDIVHLADVLAHGLEYGLTEQERIPPLDEGAWQRCGLDWAALASMLPALDQAAGQSAQLMESVE